MQNCVAADEHSPLLNTCLGYHTVGLALVHFPSQALLPALLLLSHRKKYFNVFLWLYV